MIYLFNPENDTALAADVDRYTPPRAARQLHLDGSLLPLWWAKEGDVVLSPYVAEGEMLKERFGLKGTVSPRVPPGSKDFAPWGWSRDARSQFIAAGADPACLPTDEQLERMRKLSHRRITIEVNRRLCHEYVPVEVTDPTQLPDGDIFMKLPWSSSGRGVKHLSPDAPRDIVAGMIRRQGSVLVEKALRRKADFAALFYADGSSVTYKGLSIFTTDPRGAYTGNLVAPEDQLETELSKLADLAEYQLIINKLSSILTSIITPFYTGWLGVDMMVYENENGTTAIAPCVEVNLRMTMGVVAHLLRNNPFISSMMPAHFSVTSSNSPSLDLLFPTGTLPEGRQFKFSLREDL